MSEHDETNTNAQRAPHSASPAPSAPTHSTPADDTQWSVLQERAEVREDNLDSQTQDPRIAAQIDAARARGFVPLSESESERTAKNSPEDLQAQIEAGLTQVDPLMVRPRISSRILCGVIALVFALLAFGSYRLGVHTLKGQGYEDLVIDNFANYTPQWLLRHNLGLTDSVVVISVSISLGAIAVFVALLRRRWWLAGQLVAFAAVSFACARVLKPALPRPLLMQIHSSTANSAPSGHTVLAITAGLMLVCAVPRAWRAACALFAAAYSMLVGVFVIADKWHRPCDVLMAVFLVGALAMLMLLFTRRSGMDRPGKRVSSASVQIASTVLITLGICGFAYAGYIIWQIFPGLEYGVAWSTGGACMSAGVLVIAVNALVVGAVLAVRQLTASPLTRLGQIGAPPAPPRR